MTTWPWNQIFVVSYVMVIRLENVLGNCSMQIWTVLQLDVINPASSLLFFFSWGSWHTGRGQGGGGGDVRGISNNPPLAPVSFFFCSCAYQRGVSESPPPPPPPPPTPPPPPPPSSATFLGLAHHHRPASNCKTPPLLKKMPLLTWMAEFF